VPLEKASPRLSDHVFVPGGFFDFVGIGSPISRREFDPGRPFTKKWLKLWAERSRATAANGERFFPGAEQSYDQFTHRDGFYFLKEIAEKGADPNAILRVLIEYLWNENIPKRDHHSRSSRSYKKVLNDISGVRNGYEQQSIWAKHLNALGGTVFTNQTHELLNDDVKESLFKLEQWANSMLNLPDSSERGRRPADDKANRTIFFFDEYIKRKTGKHHWKLFRQLLIAAGATAGGYGAADSQINAHIKSFQKDHLHEASFIRQFLQKSTTSL
jgi:hypothetical protein